MRRVAAAVLLAHAASGRADDAAANPAAEAAAETAAQAPAAPAFEPMAGGLLEVMLNLGLVIVAIIAFAWIVRRVQGATGNVSSAMRVAGALSVGPKERVLLIDVGERQLVVGVTPGSMRTLHVLDEPLTPAAPGEATASGFADRLARVIKGQRP